MLAVDADDTGDEARRYLAQNPRSCNVVLGEDTNLVAQFRPTSLPYYVLIDRSGDVAGTQDGGAGEEPLLDLLSNVGLASRFHHASPGAESAPRSSVTAIPNSSRSREVVFLRIPDP